MRETITREILRFLRLLLAIVIGVALGLTLYTVLLYRFTIDVTSFSDRVETVDVPVEETVVVPIEIDSLSSTKDTTGIEIGGMGRESVLVDLGAGIWIVTGASSASPVAAISLDHSSGISWNSPREILIVSEKYRSDQLRDQEAHYSTFPPGRTEFSVDTDEAWRIAFFRVHYP